MRNKIIIGVVLLILCALSVHSEHPRDMQFPPLEFSPVMPVRMELDNGLTVYFLEDHQLPVVIASALIHGGSAYDPPEKSGLAAITAALLRSGGAGSRTPNEVDEALDFVGIRINSRASSEEINLNMNALKKDMALAFEVFADMLMNPLFDSGKAALEISNQKDEIRRQNDEPGLVTRRVYYSTVYAGHPYGVYPTLASMDSIKLDDIKANHKEFYNPHNCVLAISGDMTRQEADSVLEKYFSGWQKSGQVPQNPPTATANYKPGVYYAEKDMNQAHIRFGHLCMDNKNPDRHAMDVMNFVLGGGGFVSRMLNQVRTSAGLAYSVGTYCYNRPYMGTFFAYCQTRSDAMGQALKMMMDIITEVKNNGITQEEMELAKESIINNFVFNYDTPDKIVYAAAYNEFYGFPADQQERDLRAYQAVTLEDCNRVAREYLHTDNIAIVITGNKELFDQPLNTFGDVTAVSMEVE